MPQFEIQRVLPKLSISADNREEAVEAYKEWVRRNLDKALESEEVR